MRLRRQGSPRAVAFLIAIYCMAVCTVAWGKPTGQVELFVVDPFSSQKILPHSKLGRSKARAALEFVAAKGEVESASFVVRSEQAIDGVGIIVSDLNGPHGVISSAAIDIRYVKIWYQGNGAWWSPRYKKPRKPVLVPELLLKDSRLVNVDFSTKKNSLRATAAGKKTLIDISSAPAGNAVKIEDRPGLEFYDADTLQSVRLEAAANQQVWVNVSVPETTPQGIYSGRIAITDGGRELGVLPLTVKVLPTVLQPSPLTYAIYYRGQLAPKNHTVSSELKSPEQLLLELQNIASHGFQSPVVFQGNVNPATKEILKSVRSPKMLDAYLDTYRKAGFEGVELYFAGYGTGAFTRKKTLEQLRRRVRRINKSAEKFGFQRTYFVGIDEAAGEKLRAQGDSWRAVRAAGGYVFAANNKHDLESATVLPDVAVMARKLEPLEASNLQSRNVRVLSYNNPQTAVEDPSLFRRNYGFALIGAGYEGAMLYAYQHGFNSVWNDFDSTRFRDHCFAYPTSRGVIDTLAWEGMREAIDDVRYFATARHLVDNATARRLAGASEMARVLEVIRSKIRTQGGWQPAQIRAELVRVIETVSAFDA